MPSRHPPDWPPALQGAYGQAGVLRFAPKNTSHQLSSMHHSMSSSTMIAQSGEQGVYDNRGMGESYNLGGCYFLGSPILVDPQQASVDDCVETASVR